MFNNLRFRFALICIGLAVGPLIIVGAIIGSRVFNTLEQQSLILQHKIAESVGSEISHTIEHWKDNLVLLDEVYGLGALELKEQRAILGNVLVHQRAFQEVALLDSEGQEQIRLSRTNVILDDDLKSRAGNEEFLLPATNGESYLGQIRFDDTIREPLATISVPVFNRSSGEIVSVLVAEVRFKAIWNLLNNIELPREGAVYVIDQAGLVVAHRHLSIVLRGTTIELPEVDGRAEGLSGTDAIVARETIQLGGQELVVVAEQPVSSALELAVNNLIVMAIVICTALAFSVILALFTTRRIVRPIEALAISAQAISGGDFSQQVEVSSRDEVGQLASAFNQMVADLRMTTTSIDNLNEEITKRKQVDEDLQKTMAELERSNAELERFAYIASHDLQEPLRMVTSFTQLLEKRYKDRLDADANDFIGYAVDGAKRMQQLINDLLTYSRVGTRGKPLEPTDCMTVFATAVANLDVAIRESGAEVTSDRLPSVTADEGQLVQLFQNLIGNAVKFHGEEPPRVHVSAEQSGDEWVFSVRDNGIGIDSQYLEQAFKVFQHVHGGKYRGTGIGLSIAKRIVERHGGRIWLESQPGKGTIVHFTIPAKGGKQS